jgi:hypothetical protein
MFEFFALKSLPQTLLQLACSLNSFAAHAHARTAPNPGFALQLRKFEKSLEANSIKTQAMK